MRDLLKYFNDAIKMLLKPLRSNITLFLVFLLLLCSPAAVIRVAWQAEWWSLDGRLVSYSGDW